MSLKPCWVFEYNARGWKRFDAYLTKRDAGLAARLFHKHNPTIKTRVTKYVPESMPAIIETKSVEEPWHAPEKATCTVEHKCPWGCKPCLGMWSATTNLYATDCLLYVDCPRKDWTDTMWARNPTKTKA